MAWRFGDFSPNLAPIYLCPVGTVLAFSLKMVPAVDCCVRLCTESNLLLISSFFSDTPIGKPRGWGTGDGGDVVAGSDGSPNLGPQELLLGCKELF